MAPLLPNKVLNRNIVPALWDRNIITPYQYDAELGRYSSEPVSTYYYELPKQMSIRGWCMVLIDLNESTDDTVMMSWRLHPYVDKKPEHDGILRFVKDSFHLMKATKHTAKPGMYFLKYQKEVTADEIQQLLVILPQTLNIEIVDKEPDLFNEFVNDLLVPEVQEEIDRETIAFIMANQKTGEENGTRHFENIVNAIGDAAKQSDHNPTHRINVADEDIGFVSKMPTDD